MLPVPLNHGNINRQMEKTGRQMTMQDNRSVTDKFLDFIEDGLVIALTTLFVALCWLAIAVWVCIALLRIKL
jgi:hypothetical protein